MRSLGVLSRKGGETVTLWRAGARDAAGILARRSHAAPRRSQTIDIHGLAKVDHL